MRKPPMTGKMAAKVPKTTSVPIPAATKTKSVSGAGVGSGPVIGKGGPNAPQSVTKAVGGGKAPVSKPINSPWLKGGVRNPAKGPMC